MEASYTEPTSLLDTLTDILEKSPEVRLAYVFGSVAEGRETGSSDLDLGVLFAAEVAPKRTEELASEIELLTQRSVDLVDLRAAPPLLAHHIVSRGRLLMCRDDDERIELVTRIIARYVDTAHLRRIQNTYLRERAEARHALSG